MNQLPLEELDLHLAMQENKVQSIKQSLSVQHALIAQLCRELEEIRRELMPKPSSQAPAPQTSLPLEL